MREETLPILIERLRSARRLTQAKLAHAADVSLATVQRLESEDPKPPSRRVARKLFAALNDVQELTLVERIRFRDVTGLAEQDVDSDGKLARMATVMKPYAAQVAELGRAMDVIGPKYQESILKVMDLVDALGKERVLGILAGVAIAEGIGLKIEPESFDVVHPKREVDLGGVPAVEQVTATYSKPRRAARSKGHGKTG